MKDETQTWLDIAGQDLAAAQGLLNLQLYPPAIYHCQQAVEKYLKALWVEQHDQGIPPRIHDLPGLLAILDFDLPEWHDFLLTLSEKAIASRYEDPSGFLEQMASETVKGAQELCEVLRLKLT